MFGCAVRRQKRDSGSVMTALRRQLAQQLQALLGDAGGALSETRVAHACAFIRLYCALKGIATMRYARRREAARVKS